MIIMKVKTQFNLITIALLVINALVFEIKAISIDSDSIKTMIHDLIINGRKLREQLKCLNISDRQENDTFITEYAEKMKNYLNENVNPCDDFYEYACGNWAKYQPDLKGYPKINNFEVIKHGINEKLYELLLQNNTDADVDEEKTKVFFQSCLKQNGIEPVLEYLNDEFGGWPILTENWSYNSTDWQNLVLKSQLFSSSLLNIFIMPDLRNVTNNALYLDEPELGLINPQFYLDKSKSKQLEAYKQFMIEFLKLLDVNENDAIKFAEEIIDFEIKIAKAMRDPSKRILENDQYYETTIEDLIEMYPGVDWLELVERFTNESIQLNQTLIIGSAEYLSELEDIILKLDLRVATNYVSWKIAKEQFRFLDERFNEIHQRFNEKIFGQNANLPYSHLCIKNTMEVLEHEIGRLFLKKYFEKSIGDDLTELTEALRYSFLELLKKSDWLDEETKEYAIKKLSYVELELGYPIWYFDSEDLYALYNFTEANYFENILQYKKQAHGHSISSLTDAWEIINPIAVDAYHLKIKNQIIFPAGILQPPMFHPNFPESIKFGVIGSYIGHEITHGFDDSGRQYDYKGNLKNWWSKNSTRAFEKKVRCFIDQYNNYTVLGHQINGETSLGENLADVGGLIQSFMAYQKWLTQYESCSDQTLPGLDLNGSQLFFLAYAQSWCHSITPEALEVFISNDPHPTENIRLNGALRNSPDFGKIYNCPVGSYMNPEKRCKLW